MVTNGFFSLLRAECIQRGISAEVELRRALDLGANPALVVLDLGRSLILQRKYEDVIAEINPSLIESNSGRLLALGFVGDAYLGLGQSAAARETYAAILGEDAENRQALLGVAQSYIDEQNLIQARQTLDKILVEDASYVPAWITSGSLNQQTGDLERADADFTMAALLARDKSDSMAERMALYGLSDSQLSQGQYDEVRLTLARMNEIATDDIRTLLVEARLAVADGEWVVAQRALQDVLSRAPNHRQAQMLLGAVHKESGNLEQAEMYLSAVVADMPDNAAAHRLLAEIRLALNKTEEARETLAPLVIADDANIELLSMSAAVSLQLGDFENAAELLQRGIEDNPDNSSLLMQLAFTHFRAGDNKEARRILNSIATMPTDQNEYQRDSMVVLTHASEGQLEAAIDGAEVIVARWPDRANSHNLLGFVRAVNNDFQGARVSFNNAVGLAPDSVGTMWFLAQLDELDNEFASAEQRYKTMLSLYPEDTRAMVALARIAARSNNYDAAKDWLEKARNTDAIALAPLKALGSLHLFLREFVSAAEVTRVALEINERDARLHNILGLADLNLDNDRDAEASFVRAIELDPGNSEYRLNLSRAQIKSGNSRTAIATLEESSEENLQNISTGLMLATLKIEVGATEEAARIASRLQEVHPTEAAPLALEAEILMRQGDLRGASNIYDRALLLERSPRYTIRAYLLRNQAQLPNKIDPLVDYLEERPLDTDMRLYLAQVYQADNVNNKAINEYETILNHAPDNIVAANNLAWLYFESGDSRADEAARHAYNLQPGNSSVADTLGWILVRKGQYDEGISVLRNAVELGNGRAEIRYHLAAALAELGEKQEARQILDNIVSGGEHFSSRNEAEQLLRTL